MKAKNSISEAVIKRLPRYYRCLSELAERGENRVSSLTMSRLLGFTASQVRQDLNNFGGFGQQGYGYDVEYLRGQIVSIIGLVRDYDLIVVGAGNIGRALTNYQGFKNDGFHVRAAFDSAIVGEFIKGDVEYYNIDRLESYLTRHKIDIAVIAVPKESAQEAADRVVACGVKAIWNFAPTDLAYPKDVVTENMNMSESLYMLSYRYHNREK